MTAKLLETLTLAEVALMDVFDYDNVKQALAAIREAKAELEKQEPVAWMPRAFPVTPNWKSTVNSSETALYCKPLYAAPVRTKDLTDDEIYTLYSEPCSDREMVEFARAVIAADREKNKCQ